jgi:hypothetical protein
MESNIPGTLMFCVSIYINLIYPVQGSAIKRKRAIDAKGNSRCLSPDTGTEYETFLVRL